MLREGLPPSVTHASPNRHSASLRRLERELVGNAGAATPKGNFGKKILPAPKFVRDWITRRATRAFLADAYDLFFDPEAFGCGDTPLCKELRKLWRQGVVVVISAGNEGQYDIPSVGNLNTHLSIGDPANLDESIVVGSVHCTKPHLYGVSYFSSRGPTADGRSKPDVVAPGEKILSCRARDPRTVSPYGKTEHELYTYLSGTSMAAPHVSGLIACFLSARREFIGYPDKVKQILTRCCTDLERDANCQGAGLLNLVKMLIGT